MQFASGKSRVHRHGSAAEFYRERGLENFNLLMPWDVPLILAAP